MKNRSLSKDQIKDRLLKRAAEHWGYSEIEFENVFDPIVNLLFDVCAKELEKISNEIFSSRKRITERLVEILTPGSSTKAIPSRAIMQAVPVENETVLNDHHQFFYQKRITNPYNPSESKIKSYFFGPTAPIRLSKHTLKYILLPHGLQEIIKGQYKESVSREYLLAEKLPQNTIWLGIRPEDETTVKDLMFYFYLKNSHHKDTFFYFLPKAEWYFNDYKLTSRKGYNTPEKEKGDYNRLINPDINHLNKIEEHVNNYFERNFITIDDVLNIDSSRLELPKEFDTIFQEEDVTRLGKEELLWIKVVFPHIIGNDILSDIYCATNCFPVVNKKLNETQGNINDLLNVYPLNTQDKYFLELYSALNDKNEVFEVITDNKENSSDDYAYLRYGGITRFDERNANEMIHYLIDLVRDESAAFSKLGNEFTENNLNEINQIISRFKQKMEQSEMLQRNTPYLILNVKNNKKGTLYAKYWSTDGEEANKINTFSKLHLHKGSDFEKNSALLVSSSRGGRDELKNTEKIYAYRESLISNQRIVTRQDIIILCQKHFKDAVKRVEIKNGIQTSINNQIGYTPTIDIILSKNNAVAYTENDWEFLTDDLLEILKSRALNIVPFRVFYN